jgi:ubiquinone biosynthesis protein
MLMLKQISRFFEILRIIAKYQIIQYDKIRYKIVSFFLKIFFFFIWPFAYFKKNNEEYSIRVLSAFKDLGPIYIKFGQVLSTRPDIVGFEMAKQLENLQDKLPPLDFKEIEPILKKEFIDLDNHFKSFNKKAVSAASIAEVFKATLHTGEIVAVKVIKPGIEKKYKQDIMLFKFLVSIINLIFSGLRRFNLKEIVAVLEKSMQIELNLNFEAAACSEISENNFQISSCVISWRKFLSFACNNDCLAIEQVTVASSNFHRAIEEGIFPLIK